MDYGRVRLWGSLAFVIGSALTGQLVAVWGHNAILYSLIFSVLAMLLGMLLKPSVMPQGEARTHSGAERSLWALLKEGPVWRFLLCVTLLQGRMPATTASAPFTGRRRAIRPRLSAICGRWAW